MEKRTPSRDWATDFDHTDPRWSENPYPIWDALRKSCPVAHSTRFEGGAYFPSRFEDVRYKAAGALAGRRVGHVQAAAAQAQLLALVQQPQPLRRLGVVVHRAALDIQGLGEDPRSPQARRHQGQQALQHAGAVGAGHQCGAGSTHGHDQSIPWSGSSLESTLSATLTAV